MNLMIDTHAKQQTGFHLILFCLIVCIVPILLVCKIYIIIILLCIIKVHIYFEIKICFFL